MNKKFLKIKDKPYFSQKLSEFISQLQLMGISCKKRKKLEKGIMGFLLKVKEYIFREVEREYFKEDVMTKIKEYYGVKGLQLAKIVPDSDIDMLIEEWQDDLGEADTYWDINWSVLEDLFYCTRWLNGIEKRTGKEVRVYKAYLKEWFSTHNEGDPVCIDEFFDCEMQDEETKKYYLGLAERKSKKAV